MRKFDGVSFVGERLTVDFHQLSYEIQTFLYKVFVRQEEALPNRELIQTLKDLELRFYKMEEVATTISWSAEQMLDNIQNCNPSRYVSWTTGLSATYVTDSPTLWSAIDQWNELNYNHDYKCIRATIVHLCDPREILIDLDSIQNLPSTFKECQRRLVTRSGKDHAKTGCFIDTDRICLCLIDYRLFMLPGSFGVQILQLRLSLPHLTIPVMAMPSVSMLQGLLLYEYKQSSSLDFESLHINLFPEENDDQ
jgi:hypothetical protein